MLEDTKAHIWVPEEEIALVMELYMYLQYCESQILEAAQLSVFFDTLLANETLETLVVSTLQNMQPRSKGDVKDFSAINMWYRQLDQTYNFSLGPVIMALSTTEEVEELTELDAPYLMDYCGQGDDCEDLSYSRGKILC